MATLKPVVRVGVAAIIQNAQGRLLLGIRKGSHGEGWHSSRSFVRMSFNSDENRTMAISRRAS